MWRTSLVQSVELYEPKMSVGYGTSYTQTCLHGMRKEGHESERFPNDEAGVKNRPEVKEAVNRLLAKHKELNPSGEQPTLEEMLGKDRLDLENIKLLAEQVISFTEYRQQLSQYLSSRMKALAPNTTEILGELVGARLIAHTGSLMKLAKSPGSTIQILGAELNLLQKERGTLGES